MRRVYYEDDDDDDDDDESCTYMHIKCQARYFRISPASNARRDIGNDRIIMTNSELGHYHRRYSVVSIEH